MSPFPENMPESTRRAVTARCEVHTGAATLQEPKAGLRKDLSTCNSNTALAH